MHSIRLDSWRMIWNLYYGKGGEQYKCIEKSYLGEAITKIFFQKIGGNSKKYKDIFCLFVCYVRILVKI